MSDEPFIRETKKWIRNLVIGLKLCPFASQPFIDNKIIYKVNRETETIPIINCALEVCELLNSEMEKETAFLILPDLTIDFPSFHLFTEDLEELCNDMNFSVRLIAFHPQFCYHRSSPDDTTNATNQSPHRMIHFIKKYSLEKARCSEIDLELLLSNNKKILSDLTWKQIQFKIQKSI